MSDEPVKQPESEQVKQPESEQVDFTALSIAQLKALVSAVQREITDRGLASIRLTSLQQARKHLDAFQTRLKPLVDAAMQLDYDYGSHGLKQVEEAAFALNMAVKDTLAKMDEQIAKLEKIKQLE